MELLKLDPHIENILKERYYLKNETSWEQLSHRISGIYPKMFDYILNRKFIPSSPTLMNLNTGGERNGTLSSCFILDINDSIEDIMNSMKDAAFVTKAAGGVGYNFSKLRGANENVKTISANSGGVMAFIQIFDSVLDGIRQGGKRRGAGMSMLSIYHPDILKFVNAKAEDTSLLTRSNFSVYPDTAFYETLKKNPNKIFKTRNVVDKQENELKDDSGLVYTYKMLWDKIIHNAWNKAEPGIFNGDIAADRCSCKHITRNIFCNPCSEYVHIPYTSCNLASFNVSSFVIDTNEVCGFDWKAFEIAIEESVVYMNEIIDNNQYPIEKIKTETLAVRPIGLGVMGMAHLLYLLGIPYDSNEAYAYIEKILKFQTLVAMRKSVELAKERGTYKYYDYDTFVDANKRFFEDEVVYGVDIVKLKNDIKKYGIHNSCLTSIAPTGCIEENTRIVTDKGLIKIKDLVNIKPKEKEFVNFNDDISVYDEKQTTPITSYYNNGVINGYVLTLEDGRQIKISETHRIRVLNSGKYSWKYAPEIQLGDIVISYLGVGYTNSEYVVLNNNIISEHFNSSNCKLPDKLDEKLAEYIGLFTGDGSIKFRSENGKIDGVRFPVVGDDVDLVDHIVNLTKELFGLDSNVDKLKDKNMYEISTHSINLGQYLINNGFEKKSKITSVENCKKHVYNIPEFVFKSPKSVIASYLRGLFESDGTISNGHITFYSKYKHITQQVQELLMYIGIQSYLSRIEKGDDGWNDEMFRLTIRFKNDNIKYRELIGFISNRKSQLLCDFDYEIDKEKIYLELDLMKSIQKTLSKELSSNSKLYHTVTTFICNNKSETMVFLNRDTVSEINKYIDLDLYLPFSLKNYVTSKIKFIERESFQTYDIEVLNENHTYITSNGIINHNTISYIADCSGGIEPVFGLVFTRKIEKENKTYEKVYMVDPIFKKYVEKKYFDKIDKIYEYISDNNGSCSGCEYLTKSEQSIFKVAGDITPDWHLKILAAAANSVNLSVSKTINLPRDCSETDVSNVFLKAQELGIIGVTVYRDGSREGILIHNEEKKDNVLPDHIERHHAPKRPMDLPCDIHEMNVVIDGKKERFVVLVGKLAGTVYEIFVTRDLKNKLDFEKHKTGIIRKVKKGQYDLITINGEEKVCLEDIGVIFGGIKGTLSRLVSMSLRHGTPLQVVVNQLQKNEVSGLFDFDKCVARVLKHYIKEGERVVTSEVCPTCGKTLIYIEGCKTCSSRECGWSKCS